MKNKVLAIILTLGLAAGLAACGGNKQESGSAADAVSASVEAEASSSEAVSSGEEVSEEASEGEVDQAEDAAEQDAAAAGDADSASAAEKADAETAEVNTVILLEEDDNMKNTYSLLAVNPEAPFADENGNSVDGVAINAAGAQALINWILSAEGKELIAAYGEETYGTALFTLMKDGPVYEGEIPEAAEDTKTIRLSTTTSVNDSGLLENILPSFEDKYGYTVEVQSAGTGKAIAAAESGNADLILVHAKEKEEEFVEKGYSCILEGFDTERLSFMYNFFVLCGPADDPAGVQNTADAPTAFAAIADGQYPFISRGDGSGTHTKELKLWPEDLGITEEADSFADYTDWYVSANAGMGACLVMAEEMNAYILTDKATYLTFYNNGGKIEI